jgi:hypothetical protein
MKSTRPQIKQPRSDEIRDTILNFIRTKFYQGHYVDFAKQRRHLLKWVVFELAVYLDSKAVTIPATRYIEIMCGDKGILMEAVRFMVETKLNYIPAYLRQCVQSHLAVHGEDYYEEGKSTRNAVDAALKFASKGIAPIVDPVRELAAAAHLLSAKKPAFKTSPKQQLSLL